MKGAAIDDVRSVALEAMRMCKECGATFVIDDHVELVKELGADGVHLGKNDMPIKEARSLLGEGFIIGGTANTFADVKAHYEAGADYIGCGPFRFTTTKENLSPVLGLEGYEQILRRMKDEGIDLPVVAIGGITINDIPQLMRIGMSGVALSGTVLRAVDPVAEMRQIVSMAASVEKKE
jgi:thiamine-phosphate pyrophosphorylase